MPALWRHWNKYTSPFPEKGRNFFLESSKLVINSFWTSEENAYAFLLDAPVQIFQMALLLQQYCCSLLQRFK